MKPSISRADTSFSSFGSTSKERSCSCDRRWTPVKTYKKTFFWEQHTFSEVVCFGSVQKGKRNLYERKRETEQQKTKEVFKVHFTNPFKYQRVLLKDLTLLLSIFYDQISTIPNFSSTSKKSLVNSASECTHPCHTWSQTQSASLRA